MQPGHASPFLARPRSASLPALATRTDGGAGMLAGKVVRVAHQASPVPLRPEAQAAQDTKFTFVLRDAPPPVERRGARFDPGDAAGFLAGSADLLVQGDPMQPLPDEALDAYCADVLVRANKSLVPQQRAAVGRALADQLGGHGMPPERRARLISILVCHAAKHDPDMGKTASFLMGVADGTTRCPPAPSDGFQEDVLQAIVQAPGDADLGLLRGWCTHQSRSITPGQLKSVIGVALGARAAAPLEGSTLASRLQVLLEAFSAQSTVHGLLARHLARAGLDVATTAQLYAVLIDSLPRHCDPQMQCMQAILESPRIRPPQVAHAYKALAASHDADADVETKGRPGGSGAFRKRGDPRHMLHRMLEVLPTPLASFLLASLARHLGEGPGAAKALAALREAIFRSQRSVDPPPLDGLVLGYALGVPGGTELAREQLAETIACGKIAPDWADPGQIERGLALAADALALAAHPPLLYGETAVPLLSDAGSTELALRVHARFGTLTAAVLDRIHGMEKLPGATRVEHLWAVLESIPGALTRTNIRSLRKRAVLYARAPGSGLAADLRLPRVTNTLRQAYSSFVEQVTAAARAQLRSDGFDAARASAPLVSLLDFLVEEHEALGKPGIPCGFSEPVRDALVEAAAECNEILSTLESRPPGGTERKAAGK